MNDFESPVEKNHFEAVTERKAAKAVYFWERLCPWHDDEHLRKGHYLEKLMDLAAERFGFERSRLHLWSAPFKLSKAGPLLQRSARSEDGASEEEEAELIHILGKGAAIAKPLIDLDNAVSKHLNNTKYRVLRVYFLSPDGSDELKEKLRVFFQTEMMETA